LGLQGCNLGKGGKYNFILKNKYKLAKLLSGVLKLFAIKGQFNRIFSYLSLKHNFPCICLPRIFGLGRGSQKVGSLIEKWTNATNYRIMNIFEVADPEAPG
jgi:hypothetical protein